MTTRLPGLSWAETRRLCELYWLYDPAQGLISQQIMPLEERIVSIAVGHLAQCDECREALSAYRSEVDPQLEADEETEREVESVIQEIAEEDRLCNLAPDSNFTLATQLEQAFGRYRYAARCVRALAKHLHFLCGESHAGVTSP